MTDSSSPVDSASLPPIAFHDDNGQGDFFTEYDKRAQSGGGGSSSNNDNNNSMDDSSSALNRETSIVLVSALLVVSLIFVVSSLLLLYYVHHRREQKHQVWDDSMDEEDGPARFSFGDDLNKYTFRKATHEHKPADAHGRCLSVRPKAAYATNQQEQAPPSPHRQPPPQDGQAQQAMPTCNRPDQQQQRSKRQSSSRNVVPPSILGPIKCSNSSKDSSYLYSSQAHDIIHANALEVDSFYQLADVEGGLPSDDDSESYKELMLFEEDERSKNSGSIIRQQRLQSPVALFFESKIDPSESAISFASSAAEMDSGASRIQAREHSDDADNRKSVLLPPQNDSDSDKEGNASSECHPTVPIEDTATAADGGDVGSNAELDCRSGDDDDRSSDDGSVYVESESVMLDKALNDTFEESSSSSSGDSDPDRNDSRIGNSNVCKAGIRDNSMSVDNDCDGDNDYDDDDDDDQINVQFKQL